MPEHQGTFRVVTVFARRDSSGMNSRRNIVVGLDFTPASRAALRQAARIAAWNEAAPHAVHVVESSWIDDLAAVLGIDRDRQLTFRLSAVSSQSPGATSLSRR